MRRQSLSNREVVYCRLTACWMLGKFRRAKSIMSKTDKAEITRLRASEFFFHLSLLAGVPSMLEGMELVDRVFPASQTGKKQRRPAAEVHRRGLTVLRFEGLYEIGHFGVGDTGHAPTITERVWRSHDVCTWVVQRG